jgi:hypothetical protein
MLCATAGGTGLEMGRSTGARRSSTGANASSRVLAQPTSPDKPMTAIGQIFKDAAPRVRKRCNSKTDNTMSSLQGKSNMQYAQSQLHAKKHLHAT